MSEAKISHAGAALCEARRIVIKVGSALLCGEDGAVRGAWLSGLAEDIAGLRAEGRSVIVVTSGAVALGRRRLGLGAGLRLDEKQAASAAGQVLLAEAWQKAFAPHDITVAQVLLTLGDMEDRRRYLNARAAFATLLELGALPLVNENDTVATSEIRYGDNDRLAAHAAQFTDGDLLVIMSDVDGLYTADPRRDASARHIPLVEGVTPDIESAAGGVNESAGVGSGGMASKIAAAKIAGANGCATIIAPGVGAHPVRAVLNGGPATLIRASGEAASARRKWIGGRLKPHGVVHIDQGAAKALRAGASLLPAGVTGVEGDFCRGDAIAIAGPEGKIVGQGLSAYDAEEVRKIAGSKSERIEALIGYRRRPAVIEKDDLVVKAE